MSQLLWIYLPRCCCSFIPFSSLFVIYEQRWFNLYEVLIKAQERK